jgi:alkylation response protein AidB-like acyl-CoA dehydrogenase
LNPTPEALIESARQLADDVLFPNALSADAAGTIPHEQLQLMADAGFYGISTYCDLATIAKIIEMFASGCLTTTFVWTQHLGATLAASTSDGPVNAELADDLASGKKRGGVAFAHMLRPGTPMTTTEPTDVGWKMNGSAPWVTGWGHIDVVHAAARHGEDIVWALIDAVDSPTLTSTQVRFATVDSTQTKLLEFSDHFVPASRITKVENYDGWRARYRLGLRANGSLALGVANRCCQLVGDAALTARLDGLRSQLDTADTADNDMMSAARAEASLFAVTAATALGAKMGGTSVMMTQHAQRLMREAMFVMVQGQTPTIKAEMLSRLTA